MPVISYAQNGEDVVLHRLFGHADKGRYVDIGAGDPVLDSVTKLFYDRGWRGINVDPAPYSYGALCEERPEDVNVDAIIGKQPGRAQLWVAPREQWGWSTTDPALAEKYTEQGLHFEPIEVETITLATLLDRYPGGIDFLKVDVEGAEHDVLEGGDWDRYRPRVLVVEATVPHSRQVASDSWEPILLDAGYRMTLFDGLNRFYAQHDDEEALEVLGAPANVFDDFRPYIWVKRIWELEQALADTSAERDRMKEAVGKLDMLARAAFHFAREVGGLGD